MNTDFRHRRRNTILFSSACLISSWFAVRYRQDQLRKHNAGTLHVEPHRSGTLSFRRQFPSMCTTDIDLQVVGYDYGAEAVDRDALDLLGL